MAVTTGFALAVLGRVQVETGHDPTSHILRPLEGIIAGRFGLAAAVIEVSLARLLQRMTAG